MYLFFTKIVICSFVTSQNLIIYKFNSLYHILEELNSDLNFEITYVENENLLNEKTKILNNYLIITNKKYLNIQNLFILENLPLNIFKLVEKINIEFLKVKFNSQSKDRIKKPITSLKCIEIKRNMGWCDDIKFSKQYNKLIKLLRKS